MKSNRWISAVGIVFLTSTITTVSAEPVLFEANGHYYEAVRAPEGITRDDAGLAAIAKGGYLVAISSAEENDFVYSLVNDLSWFTAPSMFGDRLGPWLGGIRTAAGWQWTTGEPFTYTNWKSGQPDGYAGSYQYLQFYNGADAGSTWGDHPGGPISGFELPRGYVIEYNTAPATVVPSPARLEIETSGAQQVTLSWPADFTGWTLEYSDLLISDWIPFPVAPVIIDGKFQVPVAITVPKRFYRLKR